jgi:hypothetical protein
MSWRARISLLAAAALLSACGSEANSDAGGGGGPDPEPATRLQVSFLPSGSDGEAISAVLTCTPPGGDHPRAEQACLALEANADALQPIAGDVACTEIYGGPETAKVFGMFQGRQIRARFNRTNGCEIDRWERLAPLLRLRD